MKTRNYYLSDGCNDLYVAVNADQDLDGTFKAECLETGEQLTVSGWMISEIEELSDVEASILFKPEQRGMYTVGYWNDEINCYVAAQHCSVERFVDRVGIALTKEQTQAMHAAIGCGGMYSLEDLDGNAVSIYTLNR